MTPAQVYRAALCLADTLDTVADEMGREDACPQIIAAHSYAAQDLAGALRFVPSEVSDAYPIAPGFIRIVLISDRGPQVADLARWAEAWRTWGEARRAELAACPVCEEAKGEAPGPMCADMHGESPRFADLMCPSPGCPWAPGHSGPCPVMP